MTVTILKGDCRDVMATLPDESVHCVVSSPPYWGLRDYGACKCGSGRFDLGQGQGIGGNLNYRPAQLFAPDCSLCAGTGRIKGMDAQIGLEPDHMPRWPNAAFEATPACLRKLKCRKPKVSWQLDLANHLTYTLTIVICARPDTSRGGFSLWGFPMMHAVYDFIAIRQRADEVAGSDTDCESNVLKAMLTTIDEHYYRGTEGKIGVDGKDGQKGDCGGVGVLARDLGTYGLED